jgi:hypothetical protein
LHVDSDSQLFMAWYLGKVARFKDL